MRQKIFSYFISQLPHTRKFVKVSFSVLFICLLNACSSCGGNKIKETDSPKQKNMILMESANNLLIGVQLSAVLNFTFTQLEPDLEVGNFKLKTTIVEELYLDSKGKNKITYLSAAGGEQTFSTNFEKPLSEFANFIAPTSEERSTNFSINFDLTPSKSTIKITLLFELLDPAGEVIKQLKINWIKEKIIILPPTPFKGKEAFFKLQNLGETLTNLEDIIIKIIPHQDSSSFSIGDTQKQEATLAELLPEMNCFPNNSQSPTIKILANKVKDKFNTFSILILSKNNKLKSVQKNPNLIADEDSLLLKAEEKIVKQQTIQKVELYDLQQKEKELKTLLKSHEENFKKRKQEIKQQKLALLQTRKQVPLHNTKITDKKMADKSLLREPDQNYKEALNAAKKELLQQKKDIKLKIKENEKQQHILIRSVLEKTDEILLIEKKQNKTIKDRIQYQKGFLNGLLNDIFAIPLSTPHNEDYYQGQKSGHKAGIFVAALEGGIGSSIVGAAIALAIGGSAPSFGTSAILALVISVLGVVLLGHSVFTAKRAEDKLSAHRKNLFQTKS